MRRRDALKQSGLITLGSALAALGKSPDEIERKQPIARPRRGEEGEPMEDPINRLWDYVEALHNEIERLHR